MKGLNGQSKSLKDRLLQEAEQAREQAKVLPLGSRRDALLPSEVYAVIPMPAELRGTSDYWTGWWTVTCNGVPARHYPPKDRDLAERFATDPAYR